MKILRLGLYIHIDSIPEFEKNKSGYGRSVWDISRNSAKKNEEYLFTYNNSKKRNINNVKIIENKYLKVIKSFNMESLKFTYKILKRILKTSDMGLHRKLSIIFHSTYLNHVSKVINSTTPDIIHIHGITYSTLPFIVSAINSKIPFIVTLHGLNMNLVNKNEKDLEISMISYLNKKNINITVVGSGMKKNILANCNIEKPQLITTVNDGIDSSSFNFSIDNEAVSKELGIKKFDKVVVYVGSLTKNKNQMILIESLLLFNTQELNRLKIFLIGGGPQYNYLQKKISEYGLTEVVHLVGQIDIDELSKYYTIADVTTLLSDEEGFGRVIIESYIFGVPVMAFKDLAAIDDLYEDGAMFRIDERTPLAVYNTLNVILNKEVDQDKIKRLGNSKTWENSINKYNKIYLLMLKNNPERMDN